MNDLAREQWKTRWISAWAVIATFGCVGAIPFIMQNRPRYAFDHRKAQLEDALAVLVESQHISDRSSALTIIRRRLLDSIAAIKKCRMGFEPNLVLHILTDVHEASK